MHLTALLAKQRKGFSQLGQSVRYFATGGQQMAVFFTREFQINHMDAEVSAITSLLDVISFKK